MTRSTGADGLSGTVAVLESVSVPVFPPGAVGAEHEANNVMASALAAASVMMRCLERIVFPSLWIECSTFSHYVMEKVNGGRVQRPAFNNPSLGIVLYASG
jgi:hypothetical protein